MTVDQFWISMSAMYGHRWKSQYGEKCCDITRVLWEQALGGLSDAQIKSGINQCLLSGSEWPPTMPEFRAKCLDIPNFEQVALQVFKRGGNYCPFTRLCLSWVDGYSFAKMEINTARKALKSAYDLAVQKRMQGEALPPEPLAVIPEKTAEADKPPTKEQLKENQERGKKEIAKLRQKLNRPRKAKPSAEPLPEFKSNAPVNFETLATQFEAMPKRALLN